MNPPLLANDADESAWSQIAPLLDEAITTLSGKDHDAVLLRFFQAKPMRAVGEQLGLSEEAAKKRVSRALDKLRSFFLRRGTNLSAVVIAGILSRHAVQAAPQGLVTKIISAQAGLAS